jgi:hypothetical protein
MAYKALGYVVWKATRWFLGRKYGHLVPSRNVALGGLVGLLVLGAAAAAAARSGDE